jgi:PAS domain S-box-containing protein
MNPAEIALIAPTTELANKAKEIIKRKNENIDIFIVDKNDAIGDALRIAKLLVSKNVKVIISRKGTATAINNANLNVSVVTIHNTLSDYMKAIEVAKNTHGLIAFFFYENIIEDIENLCKMLNIRAKYYTFKTDKDCEILAKKAIEDGAVLSIGGIMNQKYAELYGLDHITIENTEESIINAIETAKQILLIKKEEAKKQMELNLKLERYEAVLNYTHDAIISFDENGIIDVINPIAEDIIKLAPGYAKGKKIDSIIRNSDVFSTKNLNEKQLNQITDINGTYVSANKVPIVVDNKIKGAVITFQDIQVIQENERKIRRSLHKKGLVAKYNFNDILGESKAIKSTIEIAKSYAQSDLNILIQGETGSGKELFAQSIHNSSHRKNGPFVAINCATLSKNLLESELFGYEEGAFTGAVKGGKAGLFEIAHKGTIFLDEIGEIPVGIQAQLLRIIEEKEVRRIGSDKIIPIDVRIIAATNRDLKEEVRANRFRKDLYYRLSTLNLLIPPLKDRDEDVMILATYFFEKNLGIESKKYIKSFYNIMEKVKGYTWPGNIRELKNFVDRVCVLLKYHKNQYYVEKIIAQFLMNEEEISADQKDESFNLNQWEAERIIAALKKNDLSIQKTAEDLGISRTTLWRKMKKYNITL